MVTAATSPLQVYSPTKITRVAGWSRLGPRAGGPQSPALSIPRPQTGVQSHPSGGCKPTSLQWEVPSKALQKECLWEENFFPVSVHHHQMWAHLWATQLSKEWRKPARDMLICLALCFLLHLCWEPRVGRQCKNMGILVCPNPTSTH